MTIDRTGTALIRLQGVSKHYGATAALSEVDFACHAGEVHAVLGENGAGKSTLMKLMAGVIRPSAGEILVDGAPVTLSSPAAALALGIVCMFQELSLVPDLSVRENLLLGAPGTGYGFRNPTDLAAARTTLDAIGGEAIRFATRVADLPLAEQQQVEITKALIRRPRLLILDEATSALNASVVDKVFALIRRQRDEGVAVLFISHRFHEIEALADTLSVFRNGRHIETMRNGEHDYPHLIQLMIGQPLSNLFPVAAPVRPDAPVVLDIERLGWSDRLHAVSLSVRAGQVVGLGGLDGQGQARVMHALFGLLRHTEGTVRLGGEPIAPDSPKAATAEAVGLAWVPEDRKSDGLVLAQSIAENLHLASLGHGSRPDEAVFTRLMERLELTYRELSQPVADLSGGNQQKVSLIKWLALSPRCLLLSDPTRGIDVKTKAQIYRLLADLAASGLAIVLLSTDFEELIHLCDPVHVFYDGRIVDSLSGERLDASNIVAASLNLHATADGPDPVTRHA